MFAKINSSMITEKLRLMASKNKPEKISLPAGAGKWFKLIFFLVFFYLKLMSLNSVNFSKLEKEQILIVEVQIQQMTGTAKSKVKRFFI